MNKRSLAVFLLSALLASIGLSQFATNTAQAQILVIAPHPDDDILTSAGVIYSARHPASTVVWVMYMTNGDYAPTGTAWGIQREGEAVAAQARLGVDEAHLVFLGYPDGSLQSLYSAFFNNPYVPTRDGYQPDSAILAQLSNTTYASRGLNSQDYHRTAFGASGANTGANVQADLAHFLTNRAPTDIYVTGRCDRHSDHNTTYEFLLSALAVVRGTTPAYNPTVHQTIVWAGFNSPPDDDDWPLPPNAATDFTEPVRVASCLSDNSLVWASREQRVVPSVMQSTDYTSTNVKALAINEHATQGGFHYFTARADNDGHISAFVHRDEFFYPRTAAAVGSPRDPGTRPPAPDAGTTPDAGVDSGTPPPVDSGTPPPVDSGTPPPVDSGTPPPVDSGTPPVDSGAPPPADSGTIGLDGSVDSGAVQPDSGSDAAAMPNDSGFDAAFDATVADTGTGIDATTADAGSAEEPNSAWPGEDGWEDNVDDVQGADAGRAPRKDPGCSVAPGAKSQDLWFVAVTFGVIGGLARRRRARV